MPGNDGSMVVRRSHSAARANTESAPEERLERVLSNTQQRCPSARPHTSIGGGGNPLLDGSNSSVRVVCRLRPMNDREKKAGTVPAASASTERKEVAVVRMLGGGTRQVRSLFHFDDVLTSFSTQSEVFASTLDPLVDEVLAGFEATAFAYGQTGTGKTYTMEGDLDGLESSRGLVPRTAAAVIERLSTGGYADYAITCSYLEIYNEELSDLLAPPQIHPRLDLKDVGSGRGVVCTGLSEVPVGSLSDILELVSRAQERRRVAETRINARSSRSHCIFTLKVRCRRIVAAGELENIGKLHLVDLAGSECAKKASHATDGQKAGGPSDEDRERKNINQSLLTLGRVITALRDGTGRVPYRDSKLTRLLQDALGGRCKTVVIATISPALNAVEETISTLTYAEQASGVKNKPVASSLLRTIRLAATGVPGVPAQDTVCAGSGTAGVCSSDWAELEMKVAYLTQEVEEAQAALAVKYRELQEQSERAIAAESQLMDYETKLEAAAREAEEQAFLASSLAYFADGRVEAASQLSSCLDASVKDGDGLRLLLQRMLGQIGATRAQARELVDSTAAKNAQLAVTIRSKTEAMMSLSGDAHAIQRSLVKAAAQYTQEAQDIVSTVFDAVNGSGSRQKRTLAVTTCEAESVIEETEVAIAQAGSVVDAAFRDGIASSKRNVEEVAAAMGSAESEVEHKTASILERLLTSRQFLEKGVADTKGKAEAAKLEATTFSEQHVNACTKGIKDPLGNLAGVLANDLERAESQCSALKQLKADELENVQQEEKRRDEMLAGISRSTEVHQKTSSETQTSLADSLCSLAGALAARSEATRAALDSLSRRLTSSVKGLTAATEQGNSKSAKAISEVDATLQAAWNNQRVSLEEIATALAKGVATLRASNAGNVLKNNTADFSSDLTKEIARVVAVLAVVEEDISEQIVKLQAERSFEEEAVAALSRQKQTLQDDVSELDESLKQLKKELAAGRGKLDALTSSQESSRNNLFEAVSTALRQGLDSIKAEFVETATNLDNIMDVGEKEIDRIRQKAASTECSSAKVVTEVADVVHTWSASIGDRCISVQTAQENAAAAVSELGEFSKTAGNILEKIETSCDTWGAECEKASDLIDTAIDTRNGAAADLEALEPKWMNGRKEVESLIASWNKDNLQTIDELAEVAADEKNASTALQDLCCEVSKEHNVCENILERWRCDSQAHEESQAGLVVRFRSLAECGLEAAARRSEGVQKRCEEAASIANAVDDCRARTICTSKFLDEQLQALPLTFDKVSTSFASLSSGVEVLSRNIADGLDAASGIVEELRAKQIETNSATNELAETTFQSVSAILEKGRAAESESRAASEACAQKSRALWKTATADQNEALQAVEETAQRAKEAMRTASQQASERMVGHMDSGDRVKEQSVAFSSSLVSGSSASLTEFASALKEAVSAEPLCAFEECTTQTPQPSEAAAPPDVELVVRPTFDDLLCEFRCRPLPTTPDSLRTACVTHYTDKENAPDAHCSKATVSKDKGAREGTACAKDITKDLLRPALIERISDQRVSDPSCGDNVH